MFLIIFSEGAMEKQLAFVSGKEVSLAGRRRRCEIPLYYVVSLLTFGVFHAACMAWPQTRLLLETKKASVEEAEYLCTKRKGYRVHIERIEGVGPIVDIYVRNGEIRTCWVECTRLLYNWELQMFEVPEIEGDLDMFTRKEKEVLFGRNTLRPVDANLFHEVFDAVFGFVNIYTFVGVCLWVGINYKLYAVIITGLALFSTLSEVRAILRGHFKIQRSTKNAEKILLVDRELREISVEEIVPGDLLVAKPFMEVPCDCAVHEGTLVVDEGFISGESLPVSKKKGAEVLGGTKVLKSLGTGKVTQFVNFESGSFAVLRATKTSFSSAKGRAFKAFLSGGKRRPKIYYDIIWLMGVIAGIAAISLTFTSGVLYTKNASLRTIAVYALDLFYSVVSPSLPAAIWIGISVCMQRLYSKGIECKDTDGINISGDIDIVCFDKTGTLTEEGLDIRCLSDGTTEVVVYEDLNDLLKLAMSTCHSLEVIDHELAGDPLDMKMFLFTDGVVNCNEEGRFIEHGRGTAKVVEIFEFDSVFRRMSVIVEHNGQRYLFCKGSPEEIKKLLVDLPEEYDGTTRRYSLEGFRVLAMGFRAAGEKALEKREECERGLAFMSFLVFENKLKEHTLPTIRELVSSEILCLMCTGDNVLTASSVSLHCGISEMHIPLLYPEVPEGAESVHDVSWHCINDEEVVFDKFLMKVSKGMDYVSYVEFNLAIEGKDLDFFFANEEYKNLILRRCRVFARMNPSQKQFIVEVLRDRGTVCFVGDGANDCRAIKAADVGVILAGDRSDSVYCGGSTYLCHEKCISSTVQIIMEGKSTLIATIKKVEQMVVNTFLQFAALSILKVNLKFFSDMQSIYSDIAVTLPLSVLMSKFKSSGKMTPRRPRKRIWSKSTLLSIGGHCAIHLLHILILVWLFSRFSPMYPDLGEESGAVASVLAEKSKLGSAMFFLYTTQILFSGICYTTGKPFRQTRRSNIPFILFYVAHGVFVVSLVLALSGAADTLPFLGGMLARMREIMALEVLERLVLYTTLLLAVVDPLIILAYEIFVETIHSC
jgi:cation-transporting P-type ATPase 13A2